MKLAAHLTQCTTCEGTGNITIAVPPSDAPDITEALMDCPDCDDGFVPWEPDGDAEYEAKVGK